MSALSGSPVFIPLMMKSKLVKYALHVTLNVECLYISSIKHAYFSSIPKWDNVSKINSFLTLQNASAKSVKKNDKFCIFVPKITHFSFSCE